jgi:hypothetical protein
MDRNKGENEQIRIVFWNVAGIKNKENEFWKYLGEFDVVGLVETWDGRKGECRESLSGSVNMQRGKARKGERKVG